MLLLRQRGLAQRACLLQARISSLPQHNFSSIDTTTAPPKPEETLRNRLIQASLLQVNKVGWNQRAIAAACSDLSLSSAFHGALAPYDLVQHVMQQWESRALAKVRTEGSLLLDPRSKIKDKIQYGIRERLALQAPYLSRWNEAMALGAHPSNARQTADLLWRYADEIWTLAGDRSLDYNYYTKRTLFLGVYASTELYLLTDQSEGHAETWHFLQRRIDDVLEIGSAVHRWKNFSTATLSGVMDIASAFYYTPNHSAQNDLGDLQRRYQQQQQQQQYTQQSEQNRQK